MTIDEVVRYNRQERIWGREGQQRIQDAKVVILGSDWLGKYTALPLAALGVGNITILGNEKANGTYVDEHLSGSSAEETARTLRKINPQVNVQGFHIAPESTVSPAFMYDADIIIDATNNPHSKAQAYYASNGANTPFMSASISESYGKADFSTGEVMRPDILMPEFRGHNQDAVISMLFGGMLAEEAKKVILGKPANTKRMYYSEGFEKRFSHLQETPLGIPAEFKDQKALLVGAGALANFLTLALGHYDMNNLFIMDDDTVESHNLNRQVQFHDSVGLPKAQELARKYNIIQPGSTADYAIERFEITDGEFSADKHGPFDLVFTLVDNLYARACISAYAVSRGIPLISAGSSAEGSQVVAYDPGNTPCLDHVLTNYYTRGLEDETIRRISCIENPDPSVVMTNQVAAALAALELKSLAARRPFGGHLQYGTEDDQRLAAYQVAPCDCHEFPERIPDMEYRQ